MSSSSESRPMSAGNLTLERLAERLQRLEFELGAEGAQAADCGTFIPCRRLKSCGSFSLTSPTTPSTPAG